MTAPLPKLTRLCGESDGADRFCVLPIGHRDDHMFQVLVEVPGVAPPVRGDRLRLVSTDDPYTQLRPGEFGTVTSVDDAGTVHVEWDSGSTLGLIPGRDRWERVRPGGFYGGRQS